MADILQKTFTNAVFPRIFLFGIQYPFKFVQGIAGPLCVEFTCDQWFPITKGQ